MTMCAENIEVIHVPVLLDEVLQNLAPGMNPAVMVDANLGEGGHAEAFLSRFPDLLLFGIELDPMIAEVARRRLADFQSRFQLKRMNFLDFFKEYDHHVPSESDRILFDLGVSSFHFEKGGRGFSFLKDEQLDMRLDPAFDLTAYDIVNSYREKELADILFRYGEERYARRIARRIVSERQKEPIRRTLRLAEIIRKSIPVQAGMGKSRRHAAFRRHPATRSFQALRIAVNQELNNLEEGLELSFRSLAAGGRMGVITFHSLEDRIVKQFFVSKNKACRCPPEWPICQCEGRRELRILTKKPIRPNDREQESNPSSRSASLRVVEKL